MPTPACSVRYFCLGALLIFLGSVLLCALGFTIVLPHEATARWRKVNCVVINATYDVTHCACDQQVGEYERCLYRYPCLRVTVGYNHTHQARDASLHASFRTGLLYRNWADSFFQMCSLRECGDEEWNIKEAYRFKTTWGKVGETYPCFFNPENTNVVVLDRVPTTYVIHALFWPSLSLLSGSLIWLGHCFGCYRIEVESSYPQRHVGPYGLL